MGGGWALIGKILVLVVLSMYSIGIGLVDNGILRDENCCGDDELCWEVIFLEHEAYYDSATGLRTRYVLFILFLFLSIFVRWLESDFVRPVVVFGIFEASFIVAILTGDSMIRSFGNSPLTVGDHSYNEPGNDEAITCRVSPGTIDLTMICSWLGLLSSSILFYIASLNLPSEGIWDRGSVNLGFARDMRNLGVDASVDDEEDVVD